MILIAHRGNLFGPRPDMENNPEYIFSAINHGFNVEVDVWLFNGDLYLGHDKPDYKIGVDFLKNNKIWCHAKNIEALSLMLSNKEIHCFWHQEDDVTLTSEGYIWTYPGKMITNRSICVMPENSEYSHADLSLSLGICSDYAGEKKEIWENLKLKQL